MTIKYSTLARCKKIATGGHYQFIELDNANRQGREALG